MPEYDRVALGGTFDLLHKGHLELLRTAFSVSSFVIVGLTSDHFAARLGKITFHNYIQRSENIHSLINQHFAGCLFELSQLNDHFGPAVLRDEIKALIVSDDTHDQGLQLNDIRKSRGLPPVDIITVPMVMAKDGMSISSTRLRNSEIDFDGNLN